MSHDIWNQTKEGNINNTVEITKIFKLNHENLKFIPIMGNHESYPVNLYNYYSTSRENDLKSILADIW